MSVRVVAKMVGTCPYCQRPILPGQLIRKSRRGWRHPTYRGRCSTTTIHLVTP